jgi:hypothetical protein
MKRKNTFAVISILSFIISGAFTIALFTSNSVGKLATLIMLGAAVVFEMSKWCLLWEGFSGKHSGGFRGTLITLWVLVTVGSIVASSGYVLNQSNKTQNEATVSSTQYKQAEQARNVLIDSYNVKKQQIEQLRQQAAALPSNYYSMKQNIMNDVSKKTAELSAVTKDIQNPLKVEGVLVSNGYSAFFGLMAKIFEEDAQMLELWFFMALGIILELIANVFAYLYQKELLGSNYRLKPENSTNQSPPKVLDISTKKNNAGCIGFRPENIRDFSDDDYQAYITYMSNNQKNGYAPGYSSIASGIGVNTEVARSIKNHLEREGVVKVQGSRTRILKEVV